ncbi:MAG: energy-coupling factor ABC transporter ATP-binding protein [Candidatus Omnitrophota bacterium]
MSLLEIQNLTHRFPDGTVAIRNINLKIEEGEFIVLAGRNGSGKTVLARHLNGLFLPTLGKVLLEGNPITDNLVHARKRIGLIFQDSDSQIIGQTVEDDIAFGPENLKLPREEITHRVKESLAAVGLTHLASSAPHQLSGGEKRRLAIAGVLAMAPKMIVFDEPFSALDYPGVVQVLTQIVSLHHEGHTIIVITHELEKVLAHANRLILMEKGHIVEDGDPAALIGEVEKYGIKKPYGEGRSIRSMTWLR